MLEMWLRAVRGQGVVGCRGSYTRMGPAMSGRLGACVALGAATVCSSGR